MTPSLWRRISLLALMAIVGVVASGCTSAQPPEVSGDDPELVEGRELYGALCASCHGADGGGGRGLPLNEGRLLVAFPEPEAQIDLVTNGRASMPGFSGRLSEAEMVAVVRYTREIIAAVD